MGEALDQSLNRHSKHWKKNEDKIFGFLLKSRDQTLYFAESNESWVPLSPSPCRLPVPLAGSHLIHAEFSHLWIQKSFAHGRRISYGNLRRSRWAVSSANSWVRESVTAERAEQDRGVGRKAKKSHSSKRGNSSSFPWWRLSRHFWMPGFQQTTWRPP